jgi:23S rRNA (cytidine1920-2'-O)/16S rRNA (cytidine1409-2'-O)-methyltransferase
MCVKKSSLDIDENLNYPLEIKAEKLFVSLGGYKLQKALDDFNFSCKDLIVADIGASTGGFTDCLIKNDAKKIYAVDLNDQLLHPSLKEDKRVESIIKNARDLTTKDFNDKLDLIVADLSFISITYVLDVFATLLEDGKNLIVLIKPQFETGTKKRFKNGIVRDEKLRESICKNVFNQAIDYSLAPIDFTTAPINDNKNVEYLMLFTKNGQTKLKF